MRLTDLYRTTGSRLALLFLVLLAVPSLVLFAYLYWQTTDYLRRGVDDWVSREASSIANAAPTDRTRRLTVHPGLDPQSTRPFALFDPRGAFLLGTESSSLPSDPQFDALFNFSQRRGKKQVPFRGMLRRLPSGEILLVAQDLREIDRFNDLWLAAMAWAGFVALGVGLAAATITGTSALRHTEDMTRAIERIAGGDFAERLPVRRNGDDLDRLSGIVNRMLDDIQRLMQEVKGVSDGIAHDLRTPLTRLLAGLERVRRHQASEAEYQQAIDDAIFETQNILRTFSALLRISEVESGARRAGFASVDLAQIAADAVEFYEPVAEAKNIALTIEHASDGAFRTLPGDPSLLFEAIGNLVDNALKFTPEGGSVTVRSFARNGSMGIAVTDSGAGIPVNEREAVVQPFYRTERGQRVPGSGLGLSLVAAVARLHELQMAIEDAAPGCRVVLQRGAVV
ncbi:MAG: cusS 3 [Rhodospirillales bacterium]|nr:cusS 3 [Rhodospirillales bacterium]